jgi:hypothetical protein
MQHSQTQWLATHFLSKPSITSQEAAGMFRIRSLSRLINDLEAAGWQFIREACFDTTGQRYVRYHVAARPGDRANFRTMSPSTLARSARAV